MIRSALAIAFSTLLLAGGVGCCNVPSFLACDTCSTGGYGVDRLTPCKDNCASGGCATGVECGQSCGTKACGSGGCNTVGPGCCPQKRWTLLKALFGCTGCNGELYWNEWYNDPPACNEPCDQCGNYIGGRSGSCNSCGTSAPVGGSSCSTCGTGQARLSVPRLEPTPTLASEELPIRR